MPAYCSASDVRSLDGFPDETVVPGETVDEWCQQRAGELNVLMLAKGVQTPVAAPADLVQMLKMANAYGAAAMLAASPGNTLGMEELKGFVDTWLSEFVRLEGLLSSLTKEQLVAMGASAASISRVTRTPPGMALAGSKMAANCSDWRDAYPFYRGEEV